MKRKTYMIQIVTTGEIVTPFVPLGYHSDYKYLSVVAENAVSMFDRDGNFIKHIGKGTLENYLQGKDYIVKEY